MRFCLSLPSGKGGGKSLSVIPGTAADAGGDTAPVSLRTVPLDILVPVVWCPMHTEARVTSCWGPKLEGDPPPRAPPRHQSCAAPWLFLCGRPLVAMGSYYRPVPCSGSSRLGSRSTKGGLVLSGEAREGFSEEGGQLIWVLETRG